MLDNVMLHLGSFEFRISAAAYSELSQIVDYRWSQSNRIGREPAAQFIGIGKDEITITGAIFPEFAGGLNQIKIIRSTAGEGQPLLLVDGLGNVRGNYVIVRVEEKQLHFSKDGKPKQQDFTITIMRYGNDI
jgi:phage protein U